MAAGLPPSVLGFIVRGDLDGITYYTNKKGKKVAFAASPALLPASPAQKIQRDRFRAAHLAWSALAVEEKFALEEATKKTSLCLTGQNLYISAALTARQDSIRTLASSTGLTLPIPPNL